jgi:hypothetical protein
MVTSGISQSQAKVSIVNKIEAGKIASENVINKSKIEDL